MPEQSAELWRWLQEGASLYVCGDALLMAKDVDTTLRAIVERQGSLNHESAQDYVQRLKDEHRYHRHVYSPITEPTQPLHSFERMMATSRLTTARTPNR